MRKVLLYLEEIKFSHTVFALPFAVVGAVTAADGFPGWIKSLSILVAMVSARSAAMGFNRLADRKYDSINPRTSGRHLVSGRLGSVSVIGLVVLAVLAFLASAAFLNWLCLALSPVALAVILTYSLSKRWTFLCHFWLGAALAIAPAGAYLAVQPKGRPLPALLSLAVFFWVAGFDIIYSTLDVDFDREHNLKSIPAAIGVKRGLLVARLLHAATCIVLAGIAIFYLNNVFFIAATVAAIALIVVEHAICDAGDARKINRAFFHVNAAVSLLLAQGAVLGVFIKL